MACPTTVCVCTHSSQCMLTDIHLRLKSPFTVQVRNKLTGNASHTTSVGTANGSLSQKLTAENNLKPNRDKAPLTWLDQTVALVTFGNVIRKDFFCKAEGGG